MTQDRTGKGQVSAEVETGEGQVSAEIEYARKGHVSAEIEYVRKGQVSAEVEYVRKIISHLTVDSPIPMEWEVVPYICDGLACVEIRIVAYPKGRGRDEIHLNTIVNSSMHSAVIERIFRDKIVDVCRYIADESITSMEPVAITEAWGWSNGKTK